MPGETRPRTLFTPAEWDEMFSVPPVLSSDTIGSTGASLRQWSETAPDMDQPPLDHHYVALHLGGPKRVNRRGDGPPVSTEVEPGALSIIPANTAFSWSTQGPIGFAHLYLAPRLIDQIALEDFDQDPRRVSLTDPVGSSDALLSALFDAMLDELRRPGVAPRLFLDTVLRTFAVKLVRDYSTLQKNATGACHELAPHRLRRVLDFIEAHLADDLSLRDLAAVSGSSVYHFSRGFRRETGLPPYRYVVERRINRAKAMLHETTLPMSEIAARCGFNSQRQFGMMFTKLTGVSPGRFRRER